MTHDDESDLDRPWVPRRATTEPDAWRPLVDALLVSPVAARILWSRGLEQTHSARSFLHPELRGLHDPFLFAAMERAAERVRRAVTEREPILVFGDYDVDGTAGAALLQRFLHELGAQASAQLPCRLRGGYGLSAARVEDAARAGVRLIVAVDNGTTAFAAAEAARAHGIDLIVADHHEPRRGADGEPELPPCYAILNPKVVGETYPFAGLSGAGVAFKLAWAIAQRLSPERRASPRLRAFLLDALSLVAIATVADAVPLVDENRVLVAFGLKALAVTPHPGLRALCEVSGLAPGEVAAESIAFQLGPRLNAAGRLGEAETALALLTTRDAAEAERLAQALEEQNRRRRALDRRVLTEALEGVDDALARSGGRALVLAREGWHPGVIGIIAGRLVERVRVPAVLIGLEGGLGRGSARSVPGVEIHRALEGCADLLERHGGHAQAAGLEIRAAHVDAFAERLGAVLAQQVAASGASLGLVRPVEIDAFVRLDAVSRALVLELDRLGPFGQGNPAPVLCTDDLELAEEPRLIGRDREHLQLAVRQGGVVRRAVGFGLASRLPRIEAARRDGRGVAAAYRPVVSRFRGEERLELTLVDVRGATAAPDGLPF